MVLRNWVDKVDGRRAAGAFLGFRLILFLVLPYSIYLGFGDQLNFYRLAQLPGWPFFDYWVEFPPLFPFLSAGLYRLAGGNEHVYCYLLAFLLTLLDAGSILVYWKLERQIDKPVIARMKLFIYTAVLGFFPYCWWYFDPIAVFFLLLSLWLISTKKTVFSGFSIAAGFLWKVFPALAIISAWMSKNKRDFLHITVITLAGIVALYGFLWIASPHMTIASLSAQYAKGSWETVWALLDGNKGTGNFGPLTVRLDPALAVQTRHNPAVVPPIIPLVVAGIAGLILLVKAGNGNFRQKLAVVGAAWVLLIIASPGWSPQWILYIIPICLLVLPTTRASLAVALLICLSLAEWPVLFSRGRDDLIWVVILLRTLITLGLGILFAIQALKKNLSEESSVRFSDVSGEVPEER